MSGIVHVNMKGVMIMDDDEYPIGADEAAALCGVAAPTLRNWRRTGQLPPGCYVRTAGGQHRYYKSMILRWLREGQECESSTGN
jgi:DNA-binding transcriptional MerR regulator